MTHDDALEQALTRLGAVTGSVHCVEGHVLHLKAERGLPPGIIPHIQKIPKGKGMAGLAWSTAEPITTCNLGTDQSGQVQNRARTVDAYSALAVPVFGEGGTVKAVVGFGYNTSGDIEPERLAACVEAAHALIRDVSPI